MKKNIFYQGFAKGLMLVLAMVLSVASMAQEIEGDAANGKSLYNVNCASCHKLDKKMIGPALGKVTERRTTEWLVKWIINNQELRESGDEVANALFEEYNGSVMPAFPGLSEQDVMDILAYTIEGSKPKETAVAGGGAGGAIAPVEAESDNTTLLIILAGILLFLIVLLARVKNTLKQVQGQPTSSLAEDANFITRAALKSPKIITVLIIVVAVVLLQQVFAGLLSVNVDQGYQPEQPIKFSHKLHAGQNQINCSYCHYGARKSKHSNIPAAGVCMNCHMQIAEGPKYGKEEISKIYDAVGWDPEAYAYIEDYEQKPVKWIRIHKLPDLAYFNHAQHVTAGGVQCQTCHGPIQEMEEVYQYSSLTMGWCINCHREAKVQVETNDYYTEMHKKLKEKYGEDAEITVEMIGGLECGKCHY
jgi:mono/diheme cytochrome c family protein